MAARRQAFATTFRPRPMHFTLLLHVAAAGLWLGCVLTEIGFERALAGRGSSHDLLLARLHWRVDAWVELPAFLAVAATGLTLLAGTRPGPWLWAKIAVGGVAVLSNGMCVVLVRRRWRHAEAARWSLFTAVDRQQHRWGAIVATGLVAAMGLGLWLAR